MVADEPDLSKLAAKLGVSKAAVCQRALRLGLDREMRYELAAERRRERSRTRAEGAVVENVEAWGVYLNGPDPRTSIEVYRGPKPWCIRWMKAHRADCQPGTWHVARTIAATNRIKSRLGIREDAFDDEGAEEKTFDHLPPIVGIKALRPQLAAAAQKQYDAWEQDEDGLDPEGCPGGICHHIADDIANILGDAGYACWTQTASDVQHVTVIVQCRDGIVDVDVPYRIYERGSMFTWTKLPDVVFTPDDVAIYRLDPDPANIETYVENYRDW